MIRAKMYITTIALIGFLSYTSVIQAEFVTSEFTPYAGTPDGQFVWDVFTGNYTGPHSPDQFSSGTGTASLSVNPGGMLGSGTEDDLYSFFSVPTWTIGLSGLTASQAFTSVGVQVAVTRGLNNQPLNANAFQINGITPSEFINLGTPGTTGMDFYWAEWQGLASSTDYTATIAGTAPGQHTVLGGALTAYYNSPTVVDITAVPEPSTLAYSCLFILVASRYRNHFRPRNSKS